MNYRQPVQAACEELASEFSGVTTESDGEIDIRLTDPPLIIDFCRLAHRSVRELPTPPDLYGVTVTLQDKDRKSCVPWLSAFRDYLKANPSLVQSDAVVSFVESTGNDNTDRKYLRERCDALKNRGIAQNKQILVLLPDHIPEAVTQLLTVYHLAANGWMVTEDTWFSPTLSFSNYRRAPGYGIPDIVAWQSEFTAELANRGWTRGGGTIHELALLDYRDSTFDTTERNSPEVGQTLVGEVKRSDRSLGEAVKQLHDRGSGHSSKPGYLSSNCFDEGYGILALATGQERTGAGTITFDDDGFNSSADTADVDFDGKKVAGDTRADQIKKEKLITQLDAVAAQTMLCNVTLPRLVDQLEIDGEASPHSLLTKAEALIQEQIIALCENTL